MCETLRNRRWRFQQQSRPSSKHRLAIVKSFLERVPRVHDRSALRDHCVTIGNESRETQHSSKYSSRAHCVDGKNIGERFADHVAN